MSLHVQLLPFDHENGPNAYSHTILSPSQDPELINDLQVYQDRYGMDVPENFTSYVSRDEEYEDVHYGKTLFTPYGEPLKCVRAKYLKKIVPDCPIDKAIVAYLKELSDETKVAIYWK